MSHALCAGSDSAAKLMGPWRVPETVGFENVEDCLVPREFAAEDSPALALSAGGQGLSGHGHGSIHGGHLLVFGAMVVGAATESTTVGARVLHGGGLLPAAGSQLQVVAILAGWNA